MAEWLGVGVAVLGVALIPLAHPSLFLVVAAVHP